MQKFCKLLIISILCVGFYASKAQSDSTHTQADTLAAAAAADDANSSDEQSDGADSVGHIHYKFMADGSGSSGNLSRLLVQLGGAFDWNIHEKLKLFTSPNFVYGLQNNVLNEREIFDDIRLAILHKNKLYYLAFGSFEQSNLRQINARWILAAGAGYKIIQKDNIKLAITNVFLHENTDFYLLNDLSLWRNSTRLTGDYEFPKSKFSLSHSLYFQPAISEANNIRMRGSVHLSYKIATNIHLRMLLDDSYESFVVPGRKNNDFRWTFGFAYESGK